MDNAAVVAQAVAAMREAAAADAHTWNCATNGSLPFPCDCKYPALATRLLSAADALAGEARPNVRMSGLVNEEPDTCSLCGPISRRVSPDAHMYRAHGLKRSEWDCIQHPSFDLFEDGEYPYDDTDAARAAQEPTP